MRSLVTRSGKSPVLNDPNGSPKLIDAINATVSALRRLMHPPAPARRPIGFTADLREGNEPGRAQRCCGARADSV